MDYKDTLNLPKTDFPMKANLAEQEPKRIQRWEEKMLYKSLQKSKNNNPLYVLHDGPPYANGHIHIGTALNKILKDFVLKIKNAQGYRTPYIPGWDCHGLPIELKVDKELGSKKANMTAAQIRKVCRSYADKYIDIQRNDFKRLGVLADWNNPYITMDFKYEAVILTELYKFFKNGGVYKGSKPVYWCPSCVTALAEAEVEYADHTSKSVYIKFPLSNKYKNYFTNNINDNISMVIWTTTPWTLPANMAIAVNPEFEYSLIKMISSSNKNLCQNEYIVVAKSMTEDLTKLFDIEKYEVVKTIKGIDLEYMETIHPFYNRSSIIVLANYVTLDAGTGLVHTAPGHGQDDYETGLKYKLEILSPVDDNGRYKDNVELFAGKDINKANNEIIECLDTNKNLILSNNISHSYPHCWRCKNPIIFRATPQWFISMSSNSLKEKAIDAIKNKVKWIPSWGENRILSMVENRPDWCISRQRLWGVPIAVFSCENCEQIIFNENIEQSVITAFEKEGADAWFEHDNEYFLGKDFQCPHCNSKNIKKEKDILDVWFDSGTSHAAVCETRPEIGRSADMYLEGSDQHRGWFQSSLLESIGTRSVPPFKEVLTHGFVVDGNGRKMSKSIGNTIAPQEIINKYGVEILRLWVAAEDYTEDVRISEDIIKRLTESYRKIRNTARYILGIISSFNVDKDMININDMLELDQFIYNKWQKVKTKIYEAYNSYQFHIFYHTFLNFCINDLSSFYLDIIKDRAYSSKKNSKELRSAQSVMFILASEISIVISPILSFTADEIWDYLPNWKDKSEFVFQHTFPKVEEDKSELKWDIIINIRKEVNKALEIARTQKIIGHPLDAELTIAVDDNIAKSLILDEGIERIFIVSKVNIVNFNTVNDCYTSEDGKVKVLVKPSDNPKCARCWIHTDSIGSNSNHPNICKRCAEALI